MNARAIPNEATTVQTDPELLAFDAVLECASELSMQAAALIAAASSCDEAATEARLWMCRRVIKTAAISWRAAVPALPDQGGVDDHAR